MLLRPPPHHVKKLPPDVRRRLWLVAAITMLVLGTPLGVFVGYPRYRDFQAGKRFANAKSLCLGGNAEAAVREYMQVMRDFPRSAVARDAEVEWKRLVEYVATAKEAEEAADAAFRNDDYEGALKLYRRVAEDFPLSIRGAAAGRSMPGCADFACKKLFGEAQAAEEEKRWDAAKDLYDRIIAIDATFRDAAARREHAKTRLAVVADLLKKAESLEKARQWKAARSVLEEALSVMPHHAEAFARRTRALQQLPLPSGMVLILPGTYIAGDDNGESDERPQQILKTDGFYMDRTEVTNAQYARFVTETGRRPPPHWLGAAPAPNTARLPVVCVSWDDAATYAKWAGKRLPTEFEWERAARGRAGRKYPWGNSFDGAKAVFSFGPTEVGQARLDSSQEGCMDMGGNVSEWTADASNGNCRVIRGASWAGMNAGRLNPIVAGGPATPQTKAASTIAVDSPSLWGIEALGSQMDFFLRGHANSIPVIQIRKWLPALGTYISGQFPILPGTAITGKGNIRIVTDGGPRKVRTEFITGCRLLKLHHPESLERMWISYADPKGRKRILKRAAPASLPPEQRDGEPDQEHETALRALAKRALADVARSANRMAAPRRIRFANCGFRCAKDP